MDNKNSELYIDIKKQLRDTVQSWVDSNIYLAQRYRFCDWKIDDAIFFNTSRNMAILLIHEVDTASEARMDNTKLIFAKLNAGKWHFYYGGMPSLASMRYGDKDNPQSPYTFKELSENAVKEIITGGYFKRKTCEVNDKYVEDWDKELDRLHERFLRDSK